MATTRPPADAVVERGERIYNNNLRQLLDAANFGRYVVIDVDTGEYRLGDEHRATVLAFLAEKPDAILYTKLIGYSTTAAIGGRMKPEVTTKS
ncbi:MAG TPA: hypothetical protein VGK19_09045 [Capsulimonadaceae bacterium]|jgi:transcriptional accessory protein Tex/SPT6